jgi:hypothetical protein
LEDSAARAGGGESRLSTGHVLAMLDKGVVIQTYPEMTVRFVPKENISTAELTRFY